MTDFTDELINEYSEGADLQSEAEEVIEDNKEEVLELIDDALDEQLCESLELDEEGKKSIKNILYGLIEGAAGVYVGGKAGALLGKAATAAGFALAGVTGGASIPLGLTIDAILTSTGSIGGLLFGGAITDATKKTLSELRDTIKNGIAKCAEYFKAKKANRQTEQNKIETEINNIFGEEVADSLTNRIDQLFTSAQPSLA